MINSISKLPGKKTMTERVVKNIMKAINLGQSVKFTKTRKILGKYKYMSIQHI